MNATQANPPIEKQTGAVSSALQHQRMLAMQSFQFQRRLVRSPLLGLQGIRPITKKILDERRYDQILFVSGSGKSVDVNAETGGEVLDALDHYESRRAWLRLTRVDEVVPELKEVVEQFYRALS